MSVDRRKFKREGEAHRRDALIAAAQELISEGGPTMATVRAIAERAGVTPGLIRHYFNSKEDLTRAAYHALMAGMTEAHLVALAFAPETPEARLAAFVATSLRAPVMDPKALGLWAGFIHLVRRDPDMRAVHADNYLRYRDLLQGLIAALPGAEPALLRGQAIACNGILDGLWLEGCALPEAFEQDEMAQIGARAIGAILGVDLMQHLPPLAEQTA